MKIVIFRETGRGGMRTRWACKSQFRHPVVELCLTPPLASSTDEQKRKNQTGQTATATENYVETNYRCYVSSRVSSHTQPVTRTFQTVFLYLFLYLFLYFFVFLQVDQYVLPI